MTTYKLTGENYVIKDGDTKVPIFAEIWGLWYSESSILGGMTVVAVICCW